MVRDANTTAARNLRLRAVYYTMDHPNMSYRAIGKKIGCSHVFVSRWTKAFNQQGNVEDQPRSGRPTIADDTVHQHVVKAAQLPDCKTAAAIAAQIQQVLGKELSCSTVRSIPKRNGLSFKQPRGVPRQTGNQKLRRWIAKRPGRSTGKTENR